jgi:hypothetical protein
MEPTHDESEKLDRNRSTKTIATAIASKYLRGSALSRAFSLVVNLELHLAPSFAGGFPTLRTHQWRVLYTLFTSLVKQKFSHSFFTGQLFWNRGIFNGLVTC